MKRNEIFEATTLKIKLKTDFSVRKTSAVINPHPYTHRHAHIAVRKQTSESEKFLKSGQWKRRKSTATSKIQKYFFKDK